MSRLNLIIAFILLGCEGSNEGLEGLRLASSENDLGKEDQDAHEGSLTQRRCRLDPNARVEAASFIAMCVDNANPGNILQSGENLVEACTSTAEKIYCVPYIRVRTPEGWRVCSEVKTDSAKSACRRREQELEQETAEGLAAR